MGSRSVCVVVMECPSWELIVLCCWSWACILRLALVACWEAGVVVVALGYVPRPERVFVGGLLLVGG